jgi:hypothetical protein
MILELDFYACVLVFCKAYLATTPFIITNLIII